ncbi:unnamed protein product [Acanthoscelides obtectus]|uniref:Uncharacterized protein n=1 Tax=Acanthoscelides obtectus TaxID=200917 RepID=A0A9P0NWA4_ACAOB|nr:unnamed protein product [Acanthoscelides obtectus]CAK1662028.1 hypothetical protein AOBTE_LOCUS22938 [Acanthoscelides obtectus]
MTWFWMKEGNFLIFSQFSSTLKCFTQRFPANAIRLLLSDVNTHES